jgi:hypothetical protein
VNPSAIVKYRYGLLLPVSAILTSLLISAELHWPGLSPGFYSDLTGSFWPRCWVQAGSLPYVGTSPSCDYAFEYPTLSGMILYFVRAVGPDIQTFYAAFVALSMGAAVVVAWGCWVLAKKEGRELNPLFFVMPSFLIYGIYNFDIFHLLFVVLALVAFVRGGRSLSAAFLGLAVSTKLTSVVLLPVLLLELKGSRSRLRYFAVFAAVVAATNLPVMLLNFGNFLQGYQFVGNYGLEDSWYVWIFQNPATWDYAKYFGIGISGLLLLRVYTLKAGLVAKSFLAIAAYLLGTYIYTPQFNILVIPLIAVLDLRHPALYPWDGFNALIILTWFIPNSQPTLAGSWPQFFALLRAACLAMLCVSVASREGASLPSWIRARLRPRAAVPATLPAFSSP